jgi:hypothetical protein
MSDAAYADYMIEDWDYVDTYTAPRPTSFDIRIKHILLFFTLGLAIAGLSGISETAGPLYAVASRSLFLLLIASLLMPLRWGVPLFFILILVGTDLAQTASEVEIYGRVEVASIWRLKIGPIRPSWLIFGSCLIQIIKTLRPVLDSRVKRAIAWFATVPFITGYIYGAHGAVNAASETIGDVRYALMLIAGIVLFHSFLRKHPSSISVVIAALVGGLLGRHLCDVIYWFIGYGPQLGGVSRASVDSTKSTVVLVLLLAIYLVVGRKRLLLGAIIGLGSALLVVVYGTRLIWVSSVLCCVLFLYMFGARKAIILVPLVAILAFGSLKLIKSIRGEAVGVAAEKAEAFERAVGGEEGNFVQRLDPMRYSEILNSVNTNLRRFAILWGSGYGSYYRDDVVRFPRKLISAHSEYAAWTGQFHFVHNFLFQMLFKYGIIGAFIVWSLWLGPARVCYRTAFDREDPSMFNGVLGCLLAFIPAAVIHLYWTGKAVFLNGFLIAVFLSISDLYTRGAIEPAPEIEAEHSLAQA